MNTVSTEEIPWPTDADAPNHARPTAPKNTVPARPMTTRSKVPGFEWARATHMRDAVEPMMARFQLAADFPGAIHEPSGIAELDEIVPFAPGRLIVVSGRQGSGKSALSLQIARYVSGRGPVLYCLTEMSLEEVVTRAVSSTGHVEGWKLEKGASKETLAKAKEALEWLSEHSDLTTVEVQGARSDAVLNGIRSWHAANPDARMVIIDNLWGLALATGTGDSASAQSSRIGLITSQITNLAVELGIPIVLVHHLNRDAVKSRDLDASHLGGSDHIGNWASSIITLRVKDFDPLKPPSAPSAFQTSSTHELRVVKNRGGRNNMMIGLYFHGAQMRFEGKETVEEYSIAPAEDDWTKQYKVRAAELPEW